MFDLSLLSKRAIAGLTMGAALLAGSQAADAATVTVYTDRSAWEAAVGGPFSEETFDDASLNSGVSVVSDDGSVNTGDQRWDDRVVGSDTTTWSFLGGITAFGANWNNDHNGAGLGLQLTLDGTAVGSEIPAELEDEFWGVVADFSFTDVLVEAGTQGGSAETYLMDNLVYAAGQTQPTDPPVVPLPSAAWGGMALFGTLAMRRRRKAEQLA